MKTTGSRYYAGVWIVALLTLISADATAQREHIWAFEDKAGIDFNSGAPVPIQTQFDNTAEASASICDDQGRLLFYTNGSLVWDRDGLLMPNGSNLTGLGLGVTVSSTQGALIVPKPNDNNLYYLFSLTSEETTPGRLYYAMVDMRLNGGRGDIVAGQKGILIDSNLTEKMTPIVGLRCDVWVLVRSRLSIEYKAFHITPEGLNVTPVSSQAGTIFGPWIGEMKASPDRKMLVACNAYTTGLIGGLEILNFDVATGIVSTGSVLDGTVSYYGAAFSPDNSKLYATTIRGEVYQYDLTAPNPTATRFVVGKSSYSQMKLGPDGKIYFKEEGNTNTLSAINSPNSLGAACQFVSSAVPLLAGTKVMFAFPNNVPVIQRDTSAFTFQQVEGACWATAHTLRGVNAGWYHRWNDGSTGATRTVTQPGIYWVAYFGTNCTYQMDTFEIGFKPPLPQTGFIGGCNGDVLSTNAAWVQPAAGDTTTYVYSWSRDNQLLQQHTRRGADTLFNVATGNYSIHIRGSNGCDTLLDVFVDPEVYSVAFNADTTVCLTDTVRFTNNAPDEFVSWFWDFGDGNVSTLRTPVHQYQEPGSYRVTLVGATVYPCYDTFQMVITVDSLPEVHFTLDSDRLCVGSPVVLEPSYTSGVVGLLWDYGDGSSGTTAEEHTHVFYTPGSYLVRVTAASRHCPDTSFSDTVHVLPYPVLDLGSDITLCPNSGAITLRNQSVSDVLYSYLWCNGARTTQMTVKEPGVYSVTATLDICAVSDTVTVLKGCYLDIPNAFSPNGDGINDYFFAKDGLAHALTQFSMKIFTRWGQLVYRTSSLQERGWDGRLNGELQSEGVYIYIIEAVFGNGVREQYQGNVTLFR